MSIKEMREKDKTQEWELFIASLVILSALIIFGLIQLSKIESNQQPIQIENAVSV